MEFFREYGTGTAIRFPMKVTGTQNLAATGDWTPATGDVKLSLDGGNFANSTNNPTAVGGTGSVGWTLTLTAAEMSASEIEIQIVDAAVKAVEDQVGIISTRLSGLIAAARGIYVIVCDDTDFTPTTTAAEFTMRSPHVTEETTADHFNGRLLTGVGDGNATQGTQTDITDYVLANSKMKLTYTALVEAPANGSVWTIQ